MNEGLEAPDAIPGEDSSG